MPGQPLAQLGAVSLVGRPVAGLAGAARAGGRRGVGGALRPGGLPATAARGASRVADRRPARHLGRPWHAAGGTGPLPADAAAATGAAGRVGPAHRPPEQCAQHPGQWRAGAAARRRAVGARCAAGAVHAGGVSGGAAAGGRQPDRRAVAAGRAGWHVGRPGRPQRPAAARVRTRPPAGPDPAPGDERGRRRAGRVPAAGVAAAPEGGGHRPVRRAVAAAVLAQLQLPRRRHAAAQPVG